MARDEIRRAYDQHRRGAWAAREAESKQVEADIFRVGREGRIANPVDVEGTTRLTSKANERLAARAGYPRIKLLEGRWHSGRFFRLFLGRTGGMTAGAHQLSLPLRDGWNTVTRERLLIAIGEQDKRYGS